MSKTGILLINLGTPKSATVKHVGRYLTEFLNDPRVIDIPWLGRKILVNGIIVPFRKYASTKIYKKLWDDEKGSPLLYHGEEVQRLLQTEMGEQYGVHLAMRYQQPSLENVLEEMRKKNYKKPKEPVKTVNIS